MVYPVIPHFHGYMSFRLDAVKGHLKFQKGSQGQSYWQKQEEEMSFLPLLGL